MAGPWPGRAFQKVRGRGGEPATSRCGLSELCVWLGLWGVGMGGGGRKWRHSGQGTLSIFPSMSVREKEIEQRQKWGDVVVSLLF